MTLVDTSVWIDFLKQGDPDLKNILKSAQVLTHPFVIGELALGNLQSRHSLLSALDDLPQTKMACNSEVRLFIEQHSLYGTGIGFVDAHLLAAVRLTPESKLWTRDKRLLVAAVRLGVSASTLH